MKAPHFARTAVTFLAAATVAALGGGPASAAPPHPQYPQYPVNYNLISAFATGTFNGNVPPPGANRTNCRSTTHPVPVVLVHGTGANQNNSWQAIAPELANRGYCVFTTTIGQLPNLPNFGELASIYTSASQLAAFVRKVQAWTGAPKVDLVGHSQGVLTVDAAGPIRATNGSTTLNLTSDGSTMPYHPIWMGRRPKWPMSA